MELKPNRRFAEKSNEELLQQYHKTGHLEIKQELVLRYLYVIRSAAIRMRDVYIGFAQLEDIINEGVIVLMNALDKFDPNQNVKFETYVAKRVRGMIVDFARRQDWIPRNARRTAKAIQEASNQLMMEHGRKPSEQELAERLSMTTEKLRETNAKINLFSVVSLDMMLDGNGENKQAVSIPSDAVGEQPEEHYLEQESKQMLADGVRSLKGNEQLVVSLYYMEELNMRQIADVLGVSEPRVSQIHASAIGKLKTYMEHELQLKKSRKKESGKGEK